MMMDATRFIDIERYPLDRRESGAFHAMIETVRGKLREDGCAVLKGFVKPDKIPSLVREADKAAPFGHNSKSRTNAYFRKDDPALAPSHPRRRFYDRSNAFIPADNFGENSALRAIYEWPAFFDFVREALEEPEERFFRYEDPLADVIVNMADEGNGFPWHFDTNNYTVTLAIQNAEEGVTLNMRPTFAGEMRILMRSERFWMKRLIW